MNGTPQGGWVILVTKWGVWGVDPDPKKEARGESESLQGIRPQPFGRPFDSLMAPSRVDALTAGRLSSRRNPERSRGAEFRIGVDSAARSVRLRAAIKRFPI